MDEFRPFPSSVRISVLDAVESNERHFLVVCLKFIVRSSLRLTLQVTDKFSFLDEVSLVLFSLRCFLVFIRLYIIRFRAEMDQQIFVSVVFPAPGVTGILLILRLPYVDVPSDFGYFVSSPADID